MQHSMKARLAGLCLAGFTAFAVTGGVAIAAKSVALSQDQRAAVQQISNYFNGMQNLQGEFTQISPKGRVSHGLFYISRPGKLRFEYAPPNPMIVVSDGTWLTIKNRKKNRADQYPLSATPLNLVLSEKVDFLARANILSVKKGEQVTTVRLEDKKRLVDGSLILTFDNAKGQIRKWVVIDPQGRRTTVSLENLVSDVRPDPKLFKVALPNSRKPKADK